MKLNLIIIFTIIPYYLSCSNQQYIYQNPTNEVQNNLNISSSANQEEQNQNTNLNSNINNESPIQENNNLDELDPLSFLNNLLQNTSYLIYPSSITDQPILTQRDPEEHNIIQDETHLDNNQQEIQLEQHYTCQNKVYQHAKKHKSLLLIDNNYEIIYPGAIFYGEPMQRGIYQPISTNRQPLTFSTSIIGVQNVSMTVQNPSLSSIRTAISQIISNENIREITPPAHYSWKTEATHSYEQFALSFGIHLEIESLYGSIQNLLQLNIDSSRNLVQQQFSSLFHQKYYTIDIDIPNNVSSLFQEAPHDIGEISPIYVSSVTYGRVILSHIESYNSKSKVSTAFDNLFSLNSLLYIDGNLDTHSQNTLLNANIHSTVIGGSGSICNDVNSIYSLRKCIINGGQEYQTGVPYKYTLRYLKDNTLAPIVLTSEYHATECQSTFISPQIHSKVIQIQNIRSSNNDLLIEDPIELYGKIGIKISSTPSTQQTHCSLNDGTYTIIVNIPEENYITVGTQKSVLSYNFNGELLNIETHPNPSFISICTELKDSDWGIDDLYGYQTQQTISSAFIEDSHYIRFRNNNNWVELQINYQ